MVTPTRNDLQTMLAQKRSGLEDLKSKIGALEEDVHAIERVLRMIPNGAMDSKTLGTTIKVTATELRGVPTQKAALDYISDKQGGRIKVNVAKQLLIEAGFVKGNPKYAYGHIYNMLKADERYESIGEGEFQKKQSTLALP